MIIKHKNLIFVALLSIVPFQLKPSFMDTAVSAGKLASTITVGARLAGYDSVCLPIDLASHLYGYYSEAYTIYRVGRYCLGIQAQPQKPKSPSVIDSVSGIVSHISLMSSLLRLGYVLTPDSVKWFIGKEVADPIKSTFYETKAYVDKNKWIKAAALTAYVGYTLLQESQ